MEGFQLIGMLEDHTVRISDTPRTHGSPTQSFLPIPVSCEKSPSNNENKEQGRAVKLSFDHAAKAATLTPHRRRLKVPATENSPISAQVEVVPTFKLPLRPNTLPRTRHPSRTSLPVWEAGKASNLRPDCQTPRVASASLSTASIESPLGKKGSPGLQNHLTGNDFSPSNHHPDLVSSLPKESNQNFGEARRELFDGTVAVLADCDVYIPLSPEAIASPDIDDATISESSNLTGDDTVVDASQYKTVIEQQYDGHQGFFWNSATHLLEAHYLHPAYLTKLEFVSLVCGTTADISSWLHDNLPAIKHRASKRWVYANHVLRTAGISPCEIDTQFMDAFEFMDDEEQRIFVQSYKRLEHQVANEEEDLRLNGQDRERYSLLPLPDKYEFIKHHKFISRQEVDASDIETRAEYRRSRVKILKAKKAEKLQVLKEKLDEMKQIEQSIRDLETRSSPSSSSLESHYSESAVENSPSSDRTAYHESVDQQNRVSRTHLSFGLAADEDDPFLDSFGLPTKGSLFHEYTIPEPRTSRIILATTTTPPSSFTAEVMNTMPYYDGVEYQDYVDDSWLCFEDIQPSPQPMTESNIVSHIIEASALAHTACHAEESSGDSEGERSCRSCSTKVDETKNDDLLPEDGANSKAAERASVMAKLAKLVKLLHVETGYTTTMTSAGEILCQNEESQTQSSAEDHVVDKSIEKLQHSQCLSKRCSTLSVATKNSSTSTIEHTYTTEKVVSDTRDLNHNGPKSFHIEFLEPVLERHMTNTRDVKDNSTLVEPTRIRRVRKKMSKFFGSLRRKERATQ